eukprot:s469_g31.t1
MFPFVRLLSNTQALQCLALQLEFVPCQTRHAGFKGQTKKVAAGSASNGALNSKFPDLSALSYSAAVLRDLNLPPMA